MKLLKKLFSFSIGSVAGLIIGLISTPIITRIIDPAEFGIAAIFMTVSSLLGILALSGLDQAFVRFFYEKNRLDLLKKCIMLSVGSTAFCILVIIFFSESISSYISSGTSYALLMILNVITLVIFRFSLLILRMLQYGYRYSIIQILQRLLDLLFVLSFTFIVFHDRYALIFSSIVTSFLLSIITLFLSRAFWRNEEENMVKLDYKAIMSYSLPLLLATLMMVLFQSLDKLFLNAWVSSTEFGIYAASFKLMAILNIIQTSFTIFWAPASLEHYKKYPHDKEFYGRVSKGVTILMITVCIAVVLMKDVLVLFLGPDYQEASSVIALLVLMPVMYTMSETTVQGVIFSMKSQLHIIISSIALVANIIFCWWLIPLFGMEGAALSVAFSYIIFYLARTYYGMKHFRFDNKVVQTLLLILSLVIWIVLVVFIDSQSIHIIGGIVILIFMAALFYEELNEYSTLLKTALKRS